MLYDVTQPKHFTVASDDANPYLDALRAKLQPNTLKRIFQTAEDAIENVVRHRAGRLVWTKTGVLLGRQSPEPYRLVEHFWRSVEQAVGPGRNTLKAAGSVTRQVIAGRDETWLCYRRDSDEYDPDTGKLITVSEYWISEDYVPQVNWPAGRARRSSRVTVDDLRAKFSRQAGR